MHNYFCIVNFCISVSVVNTVQLSTCKTDPVCNYDQNEKQHCVPYSLSESVTYTGK